MKLLVETTCVQGAGWSFPNVIFATDPTATNIPIGNTWFPALLVLFVMFVIYPTIRNLGHDVNFYFWFLKRVFPWIHNMLRLNNNSKTFLLNQQSYWCPILLVCLVFSSSYICITYNTKFSRHKRIKTKTSKLKKKRKKKSKGFFISFQPELQIGCLQIWPPIIRSWGIRIWFRCCKFYRTEAKSPSKSHFRFMVQRHCQETKKISQFEGPNEHH